MPYQNSPELLPQLAEGFGSTHKPEDLFTFDQRLDAIAEILAEITLEVMKKEI